MAGDSFQEVTYTNWFQRMGQSFIGALIGILLFLVSFVVLFWNEGRAVDMARALDEAGEKVITVASEKVDSANDGKLVYVTGKATTEEKLTDDVFGVSAKVRLVRKVEMYQWKEEKKTETRNKAVGGGQEQITTYTYAKVWSPTRIDSGSFKQAGHDNPGMPLSGQTLTAKEVDVGAFRLSPALVNQIGNGEKMPVSDGQYQKMPERTQREWKLVNGELYKGANPTNPAIGDLRVSFTAVSPVQVTIVEPAPKKTDSELIMNSQAVAGIAVVGVASPTLVSVGPATTEVSTWITVSVIAQQQGKSLIAYQPKSASAKIEKLVVGEKSAREIIEEEKQANTTLTWILRLVGFVLMAVGIYLVLNPLTTMTNIVPFIGELIGNVVGFMLGVFAVCLALPLSLITIAIAWLFYRPLLALGILAGAAVGIVLLVMLVKRMRKPAAKAA